MRFHCSIKSSHFVFFASLLLGLSFSISARALNVMIDAGHGGIDTGAVYGSAKESDLVLKISKQLVEELNKDPGIQAKLTRTEDKSLALQDRVKIAEDFQADLFVSLHANATVDRKARGVELYFQNSLPPDEDTLRYAMNENQLLPRDQYDDVLDQNLEPSKKNDIATIIEDLRRQNRVYQSLNFSEILKSALSPLKTASPVSIKQAPFFVITKSNMPSVLIEVGFVSNPSEAKKLLDPDHQRQLAAQIKTAILKYRDQRRLAPNKNLN